VPGAEAGPGPVRQAALLAGVLLVFGSVFFWPAPSAIPLGWGRFLLASGLLSTAAALAGRPLKVQKRRLDDETEELSCQVAPSLPLAGGSILGGALGLLGGEGRPVRLGPGLVVLGLMLVSHGVSGGFFFKVVRRTKP
jgi:hypothetical protein